MKVSKRDSADRLKDIGISPVHLLELIQQPGQLFVDIWFEGMLLIEVKFSSTDIKG